MWENTLRKADVELPAKSGQTRRRAEPFQKRGEPFSGIFSRNRQMHGTDAYDHAALRLRLLREHGLLGGGEGDCPAQQFYPVDAACLDKAGIVEKVHLRRAD